MLVLKLYKCAFLSSEGKVCIISQKWVVLFCSLLLWLVFCRIAVTLDGWADWLTSSAVQGRLIHITGPDRRPSQQHTCWFYADLHLYDPKIGHVRIKILMLIDIPYRSYQDFCGLMNYQGACCHAQQLKHWNAELSSHVLADTHSVFHLLIIPT